MKVLVDAEALQAVLNALFRPSHYIRELQAIRGLPGGDDPIGKLIEEYNEQIENPREPLWIDKDDIKSTKTCGELSLLLRSTQRGDDVPLYYDHKDS